MWKCIENLSVTQHEVTWTYSDRMLICLPAEADIVLDAAGKGNNCRQQAITGALSTAITYMLIGIFPT